MHKKCQIEIEKLKKEINPLLQRWFLKEQREFPWRESPTPYAVWISEVMLQQTQAAVVIPYFERWIDRFPSIHHLAQASLDEVIKMWEGLGYYSRARNLHEGARYLVEHFDGILPEDPKLLKKIKGIGPYTIGAIRSFAFHQKAAAVDGNVLRVLSRYFLIEKDLSLPKNVDEIRHLAEAILPDEKPWITSEALIELGATICSKKPRCSICPLEASCLGKLQASNLPYKSKKIPTEILYRAVAIIEHEGKCLIKRGEKGKLMSDLYEFPYFSLTQPKAPSSSEWILILKKFFPKATWKQDLSPVSHSFTCYRAHLFPALLTCNDPIDIPEFQWHPISSLVDLPFSSGHRRILQPLILRACFQIQSTSGLT